MDLQSAMETFAAWANFPVKQPFNLISTNGPQSEALALLKSPQAVSPSPGSSPAHTGSNAESPIRRTPSRDPHHFDDVKRSSVPGKSLPVHCVVEAVYSVHHWKSAKTSRKAIMETDTYVITPTNTNFQDLVPVALQRLGYSKENFYSAKGYVGIKNWKPISINKIAENPATTVGDILGELTTVATLRIKIFRTRPCILADMKDKLLRLLLVQSQSQIIASGCPLDDATLLHLVKNQSSLLQLAEPNEETRRKFDLWWSNQMNRIVTLSPRVYRSQHPQPSPPTPVSEKSGDERVHPAIQTVQSQYPTQKTRMRTSFDPELELPKLQRWFMENPHPSRDQIKQYVHELNNLDSRKGRKPLDVNNVVYWFKNARAAQKRAETRSLVPGMHGLMSSSMNGYASSDSAFKDLSPVSADEGRDEFDDEDDDEHISDIEDHDMHPPNDTPLSLTAADRVSNEGDRENDKKAEEQEHNNLTSEEDVANKENDVDPKYPENKESTDIKRESEGEKSPTSIEAANIINNNNNIKEPPLSDFEDDETDDFDMEDAPEKINRSSEEEKRSNFGSPCPSDLEKLQNILPRSSLNPGFPMIPNAAMFNHNIMYMNQLYPGFNLGHHSPTPVQNMNMSMTDERRKRNRTFIDPVSEVPRLEQWFILNTHPSQQLIEKYTNELNRMPYRQKFPRLEPKNVQFWFKNRRAKCKRLKASLLDGPSPVYQQSAYHQHLAALSAAHGENTWGGKQLGIENMIRE
uniref:DNA-binding protein SATB1 n=2 Tax=Cacopsylla melanoneura TaxID=428564 RepID=A0A8D8Z2X4_9HEMI